MGGERRREGRNLRFCLAGLTVLLLSACLPLVRPAQETGRCSPDERFPHLQRLQPFVDRGDFDGALRAGQEALESDPAVADAALFDLALLAVHHGNPKKDHRRALILFSRMVREHPDSPLADEAKVWIGVLESIERARRIDIEIEEMKKEVNK